jgi:RNA polymerase sigma factor FliA
LYKYTAFEQIPAEKIKETWLRFKATLDPDLRDKLITHYLFLVKHIVNRLAVGLPSHVKTEDMYSTGIIGLIRAVEKYDPTMKNKFETYASLLIKGAIIDEMRSLDWVPRSIHQKANMIEKAQVELQQVLGRDPTEKELARKLDISIERLQELLLRVRPAVMLSLNADNKEDDEGVSISEKIPDGKIKTSFEVADRKEFDKMLKESVVALPEQEKTVLVLYYYENLMLKEIGKLMGISESRVSQIHSKALLRMRSRLKDFLEEFSSFI